MSEKIRNLFGHDSVYGAFWIGIIVVLFFLPVVVGRQSLTEAVPTFYTQPSPSPSIKTLWQVDGGWHTGTNIPFTKARLNLIKEGIAPLWDSYSGGGEPFASNVSGGIYYPLRFIFFSLWDTTQAFDWYFLLRFFIAGLGMFLYLRDLGLRRLVALWGGIAYAFCGYFLIYLTYSFLDVDSLFPWILLAIERYVRSKDAKSLVPIVLLLSGAVLIGHPEPAIISCIFAAFYFVWRNITEKPRKEWGMCVKHGLLIILCVLLITSPFTLDFFVSWSQGATAANWYDRGVANFHPMQLLHFLINPSAMPEVAFAGHLLDRYETIIPYIGISVLLLFLLSIFVKNKPPQVPIFYTWIVFVILKNAGFPLVNWIGSPPLLNQIGWHKAYGPMSGAIIICAAIAFEYIIREQGENIQIAWHKFYKLVAVIPLLFIGAYAFFRCAFISVYVPNLDFFNRDPETVKKITAFLEELPAKIQELALYVVQGHNGYFAVLLFLEAIFFAIATLIIIRLLRNKNRHAALAMVILTTIELFVYMPKIRDGFRYLDPYATTPPYVTFLQDKLLRDGPARTFALGGTSIARSGELYRIPRAQSSGDVKARRYFSYIPSEIIQDGPLTGMVSANRLPEIPQKFFDAFTISYLLSEQALPPASWYELIYDKDMKVYENKNALPKAYTVFQKEITLSPEEARAMFYDSSFDPHTTVILEDKNAIALPSATNPPTASPAKIIKNASNEIIMETATDRDGVLVLTDTFYPGWNAYLDGVRAPIYPANVMFRGIFLPQGTHAVIFRYEPWWFWPSIIISLMTLVGTALVITRHSPKDSSVKQLVSREAI